MPHLQNESRRRYLKAGLLSATTGPFACSVAAQHDQSFEIKNIERTTIRLPYRTIPRRAMDRELPHWRYVEIFEVQLKSGEVGIGETLLFYTWGVSNDDDVARATGKNAASLMWDDSLGAGLQMALFDAVAKTIGVPIHRLLGPQRHERTPLSWWNIDMAPADMAAECAEAYRQGYLSYKTKGRPWFDLWQQIELASQVVPEEFKLDMDFNDTLLDADRAIPILKELERNPRVDIYETPIPQSDLEGNRRICAATRVNVALHYGTPAPIVAAAEKACDGFVIGGGASSLLQSAAVAATADLPFWLQLVGTGITAAFSLHFGAVCSHATWPAVNCHQLYQHDLLQEPIRVEQGYAQIPTKPGLGFEVDWNAIRRYQVAKPNQRPDPPRLLEVSWPDGRRLFIANNGKVNFVLTAGNRSLIPFFERGVSTRLVANDGSTEWKQRYERARKQPFFDQSTKQ
ncbi:MAG: mandelate racemase/muconate lactonizing enzyme family protein [Pirellulaceae bacterium]|nr:mandelate racemase/muconate lactonizing enzyme family protein [Pirellulaceae bacterium]